MLSGRTGVFGLPQASRARAVHGDAPRSDGNAKCLCVCVLLNSASLRAAARTKDRPSLPRPGHPSAGRACRAAVSSAASPPRASRVSPAASDAQPVRAGNGLSDAGSVPGAGFGQRAFDEHSPANVGVSVGQPSVECRFASARTTTPHGGYTSQCREYWTAGENSFVGDVANHNTWDIEPTKRAQPARGQDRWRGTSSPAGGG